ncbi:MAG TPA: succinylglutamate desuccinylase/aspartoacylase family protein [Acidocella sp.]|nr:MAG: peptidase M14 [Acidocella sp. 20-61-6]HQT47616.1 succinylglutamate desuccinylase/aspartoacylase family protein [Acidocella sp.]
MTSSTPQAASTHQLPALPGDLPVFPVHTPAPDLSPYLAGNTGIRGFTTRDSGQPGPHVVLVSLIHGNEIAGATVLAELLAENFSPLRGRLTLGFANLAAFARFDPTAPLTSRFIEEDMNRVWDDIQLFGVRRSVELDRAREIRPLIDTSDILLDLHSMLWPSPPLLLCGPSPRGKVLARNVATPAAIIADDGHVGGKRLIDYGHFTATTGRAAGVLVEAGQHWEAATIAQTRVTVRALLHNTGMAIFPAPAVPQPTLAQVTHTITAHTHRFVFVRDFSGNELIPTAHTLIAHDGETEIRTPYENCMLVMPCLRATYGHTAVRLARLGD